MVLHMPDIYKPASWRNTLPVAGEKEEMGIGFDLENGEIVRLCLDLTCARHLSESIAEFLANYERSQPAKSHGRSSLPGSMPHDGQYV